MDISLVNIINTAIGAILGSGLATFYFQKRIENLLNKDLFRFKLIYSNKTDILNNLFQLFIKSEKAIELFLSRIEPKEVEKKNDFLRKTYYVLVDFINYFEKNEIFLDKNVTDIASKIKELFEIAISTQSYAALMEEDRPSKVWEEAVNNKQKHFEKIVKSELPLLKEKFANEIRKSINK